MQNLHAYLKNYPAYIGEVKCKKFTWQEYEEANDGQGGVRKVCRSVSQVSTAIALNYDILREKCGIDFEKYKWDENENKFSYGENENYPTTQLPDEEQGGLTY